jgi:hypothetical protein
MRFAVPSLVVFSVATWNSLTTAFAPTLLTTDSGRRTLHQIHQSSPAFIQESVAPSPTSEQEVDQRLSKLQQALRSFQSPAAEELLSELSSMRELDQVVRESYLDEVLTLGPDRTDLPFWARLRPVTRFSKRARWASLQRTLDWSTPPPNSEEEELVNDPINLQRRRRRALLSILRALASSEEQQTKGASAIATLEKRAKREQSSSSRNSEDMIKRRPEDLETPNYSVLTKRTLYEIRFYEPFAICSVSMSKPRPVDANDTMDASIADPKQGSARAFGSLAGYLFGKNQQQSAMKMTTPVLMRGSEDSTAKKGDDDKVMSFVLPSEYWKETSLAQAPQPLDGSGVTLERIQGGDRAAVMFGGYASKDRVAKRKQQLLEALVKDKEWEAVATEPVTVAQYNDPFTPPWKRLNEVSVAVMPRSE